MDSFLFAAVFVVVVSYTLGHPLIHSLQSHRSLINVFYRIERVHIFAVFRGHDFRSTYITVSCSRKLKISNSLNISIHMMRSDRVQFFFVGIMYNGALNYFIMLSPLVFVVVANRYHFDITFTPTPTHQCQCDIVECRPFTLQLIKIQCLSLSSGNEWPNLRVVHVSHTAYMHPLS